VGQGNRGGDHTGKRFFDWLGEKGEGSRKTLTQRPKESSTATAKPMLKFASYLGHVQQKKRRGEEGSPPWDDNSGHYAEKFKDSSRST